MWQNSKTQSVTKLKKENCDKTQLKLGQNSKTQIETKLENSNCDKTQKSKLWRTKNTTLVLTKLKKI